MRGWWGRGGCEGGCTECGRGGGCNDVFVEGGAKEPMLEEARSRALELEVAGSSLREASSVECSGVRGCGARCSVVSCAPRDVTAPPPYWEAAYSDGRLCCCC